MKQLTGMFPSDNIVMLDVPRPPEGLIEALMELGGAVCLVSDVMDALGLTGVLPASLLRPVIAGRTIAGPALTIRKVRLNENERDSSVQRRGDIEAHNLTTPGDVLVIEGYSDVSNMGGLSALTGKRQGSRGAIIWGGCRDIAELREIDYPVWSTAVTPITGVGRVESEIINGDVQKARSSTATYRSGPSWCGAEISSSPTTTASASSHRSARWKLSSGPTCGRPRMSAGHG
jgi:4-hydroxy-4-methyl-2-oxoglutarate aldolase